ncbi:MAG: hypothetical protein M0036_08695 [Desulfobacteraceae bacterium]|nr:hypothetical protein [Desulfobacteraceae bacterium]
MLQCNIDPKVKKRLDALRRSGKKACLAAERAEEIIGRLKSEGVIPDRVGTVTKHGELRIKGVMKYDLGSGYRLVTFKNGCRLFLLYVGTHDDCHRWIENNRELTVEQIQERCELLPVQEIESDRPATRHEAEIEADFDPLASLSEKELRQVFCGLVDAVARGIET